MTSASEHSHVRTQLVEIEQRLRPDVARRWAVDRLEEMFRSGRVPDPHPDGMVAGRIVTLTSDSALDAAGRRIADLYMPWIGKRFDATANTGTNVLRPSARLPLKLLWPSYHPREFADRLEAFPFRTYVGGSELDPGLTVLKIDYDFEENPRLIVRNVLDELVDVGEGVLLGKSLYRRRQGWRRIGFFTVGS